MRRTSLTTIAAACLLATACSSPTEPPAAQPMRQPTTSTPTTANAAGLAAALAKRIPTIKVTKVYTADDDPNHLLGRPGQYTGEVAFADSRVQASDRDPDATSTTNGGGIEVFADTAGATARRDYIQGALKASPTLGTEYDYIAGTALLRVSGILTPAAAREYEAAWPDVVTDGR